MKGVRAAVDRNHGEKKQKKKGFLRRIEGKSKYLNAVAEITAAGDRGFEDHVGGVTS